MIKFNLEKLEEIIKNIYLLCHVKVSIFDENMNEILYYPKKYNSFCALVRSKEIGDKKCIFADNERLKEIKEIRHAKTYICPHGLTEVFAPIMIDENVVGFMTLGQILTENTNLDDILAKVSYLGFSDEVVKESLKNLDVVSNSHIKACTFLVNACAQYVYIDKSVNLLSDDLADKIKKYIDENLYDKITVTDLCNRFYLSRVALYNIFDKFFSQSVAEYICNRKLHKAKKILEQNPSMSIREVSDIVGIDENYFSKIFKKKYGITPKKYQKTKFEKEN